MHSTLSSAASITNLLGDGANGVYLEQITGTYPAILFHYQGGGDENETANRTKNLVYAVRAVSNVSQYQAGAIDDAIDTVLHGGTLTVSGWTNFYMTRIGELKYTEPSAEGVEYYHRGGLYRIRLDKS